MVRIFSLIKLSRRRIQFLSVLTALIVVVSSISFYSYNNKPHLSADSEFNFNNPPEFLVAAIGCAPQSVTPEPFQCTAGTGWGPVDNSVNIGQLISKSIGELIETIGYKCLKDLAKKIDAGESPPSSYTQTVPLGVCTFKIEPSRYNTDNRLSYNVTGTVHFDVPAANFTTGYNDKEAQLISSSKEKYPLVGSAENRRFSGLLEKKNRNSVEEKTSAILNGNNAYISDGAFDGPIIVHLDSTNDRTRSLVDFADYQIDKKLSKWTIKLTGDVNMRVALSWKNSYVYDGEVTKLDFCTPACKINVNEYQKIRAHKLGTNDNIVGDVESEKNYTDVYSGTGYGDLKEKKVHWNTDLKIDKTRRNKWLAVLSSISSSSNPFSTNYSSDINVKAVQLPFLKNTTTTNSFTIQDLTWDGDGSICGSSQTDSETGMTECNKGHVEVKVNKSETKKQVDGSPDIIKRSGTGTFGSTNTILPIVGSDPAFFSYSGNYDNKDKSLLIKSSSLSSLVGTRREPFDESASIQRIIANIFDKRYPVKGFFTASIGDPKVNVISTPKIKTLPKMIVLTNSFNDKKDYGLYPSAVEEAKRIETAAKSKGVQYSYHEPRTDTAFLSLLNYLADKEGVLLVHFGHGDSQGSLQFPDSMEGVDNGTLILTLEQNHITAELIANSCFYRSPLAATYGGNLNVGVGWDELDYVQSNLYGLDGAAWNNVGSWVSNKICADFENIKKN